MPANNRAFWLKKLSGNKARDRLVNGTLRKNGWRIVRIWEHDLVKRTEVCVRRIQSALAEPSNDVNAWLRAEQRRGGQGIDHGVGKGPAHSGRRNQYERNA
jgi:G:T-mismatch repair DNA endonuclease (very short patch repair protein)